MASPATVVQFEEMDDAEFERRTLDVIRRQFGVGGLARFLMLYRSGTGDYTRDRHQWLSGVTLEDLERELLPKA